VTHTAFERGAATLVFLVLLCAVVAAVMWERKK
jgi:hypothetical protein